MNEKLSRKRSKSRKGQRNLASSAGGVVIDQQGHVALRKVLGSYGGYGWTWAKGRVDSGESLKDAAFRETLEEMGLVCEVGNHLIGPLLGDTTETTFFMMKEKDKTDVEPHDHETEMVIWADASTAKTLIVRYTSSKTGKARDLKVLQAVSHASPVPLDLCPGIFPRHPYKDVFIRKALGGSTGAKLVCHSSLGINYVRKVARLDRRKALNEEVTADELYQMLGVEVPSMKAYSFREVLIKLSIFNKEGRLLKQIKKENISLYRKAVKSLQEDFVVDAFLGNWDVIGLNFDNILVMRDGTVLRVDNGGALRYRAKGQKKRTFTGEVTEINTMRDPLMNYSSASIFSQVTDSHIRSQVIKLVQKVKNTQCLNKLELDLKAILKKRLRYLIKEWVDQ